MEEIFYRDSLIKINTKQIINNINEIKEKTSSNEFLYVVVKANGYGHGLLKMAELVRDSNGDALAVARLDEALRLRANGCLLDILFLGVIRKEDVVLASENDIVCTVNDIVHAQLIASQVLENKLRVHLKYNTGMNRLGVNNKEELQEVIDILSSNPNIIIEGLFTHFATADGEDKVDYFYKQLELFKDIVSQNLYDFKYIHCTNSASLLKHHQEIDFTTANRCGIGIYGYVEPSVEHLYNVKGAFTLVSKISNVKQYPIGTPISYGGHYQTISEGEYIATIPLGYADGFIRMFTQANVKCGNQYGKIIGSVCMDQLMISFSSPVVMDDEVVVIDHNDKMISFDKCAISGKTIVYEVITGFNERIPLYYY